jgi:hypothetical protein
MLEMVNNHCESLASALTQETNNQIAYLELNISSIKNSIKVDIYQKPTAADTIVNNQSCHPGNKKTVTLHRLELNTVITIAENNGYKREKITTPYKQIETRNKNRNIDNEQQKWATFTYTRLLHMHNC